jgi:hypothetical protein
MKRDPSALRAREVHNAALKQSCKPHLFEPDDSVIACESPYGCGHPKKLHRARGNRCGVGGCKCRRYFVGPAT